MSRLPNVVFVFVFHGKSPFVVCADRNWPLQIPVPNKAARF